MYGIKYNVATILNRFYPRWKEYESMHAESLQFSLDEAQWQNDWAELLNLASQPGEDYIPLGMHSKTNSSLVLFESFDV